MIESGIDYRDLYKAEKKKNADLLAKVSELEDRLRKQNVHIMNHLCDKTQLGDKVSEQEKEIERLKQLIEKVHKNHWDVVQQLKEKHKVVSEQSQRITNLIEVKDKLYYRCEALEEALREALYDLQCVYITCKSMPKIEALLK